MKILRKIILAGAILLGSMASAEAKEPFSAHFYNFNKEIYEGRDNPYCLDSNLIIKAQEGYELDEQEQEKVREFFQDKAGDYIADKLAERLKKSGLRKYVEPIEKVVKGAEVRVLRTEDKIKIKPDVDLDSENNLRGGLDFSYRNSGLSVRSDGEVRVGMDFFKEDRKRVSVEGGYEGDWFLGLKFGIIH